MNNFFNNMTSIANFSSEASKGLISAVNPVALIVFGGSYVVTRVLIKPDESTHLIPRMCKEVAVYAIACFAASLFTASPVFNFCISAVGGIAAAGVAGVAILALFILTIPISTR